MIELTALADHGPFTTGFTHLWLKYVSGFRSGVHCARCLVGPYSAHVRPAMLVNVPMLLDEAESEYLYLCGVARPYSWVNNMHLAVVPEAGSTAEACAWNGIVFEMKNARAVPIPELPDGYEGYGRAFTSCRNWQFGVSVYGLEPRATPTE